MRIAVLLLAASLCLWAQTPSPDAFRTDYRAWRDVDPNLEKEAAPGRALAERAKRAAEAEAKYAASRKEYWKALLDDAEQLQLWISNSAPMSEADLAPVNQFAELVETSNAAVSKEIVLYTNDPDPGFQQVRLALEREQSALTALKNAMAARELSAAKAAESLPPAVAARAKALPAYQVFTNSLKDAALQADREEAAWAAYYDALSKAAPAPPTGGVTIGGVRIANPIRPADASSNPAAPGSIPPLPLTRYVGSWVFPPLGGLFYGPQPEMIELEVRDNNGQLAGTLVARFKTEARVDPELKLDFSGPWRTSRNQIFALQFPDGVKGSIELIPGSAFNLIEVNFQTQPRPGKISVANFVLVKK